jgi:hypothetical protein
MFLFIASKLPVPITIQLHAEHSSSYAQAQRRISKTGVTFSPLPSPSLLSLPLSPPTPILLNPSTPPAHIGGVQGVIPGKMFDFRIAVHEFYCILTW